MTFQVLHHPLSTAKLHVFPQIFFDQSQEVLSSWRRLTPTTFAEERLVFTLALDAYRNTHAA
jgi:hypothetical protein